MSRQSQTDPSVSTPLNESLGDGDNHKLIVSSAVPQPSHPSPTVPPRILSGGDHALRAVGHSQSCIELNHDGAISSCDCKLQPLPDTAVLIGTIIRFVRQHRNGIRALPAHLTEPLIRHLQEGDPCCRVVASWLFAIGVRDRRILLAMRPDAR